MPPRAWLGPADALLRSDQPFESFDLRQCPSVVFIDLRDRKINASMLFIKIAANLVLPSRSASARATAIFSRNL